MANTTGHTYPLNPPVKTAHILAAGEGRRLKPLTDAVAKALIPVHGRPILEWTLDHLKDYGIENVVINVHHLGDQVTDFVATYNAANQNTGMTITVVEEPEILLGGGGARLALEQHPELFQAPFFQLHCDVMWLNGPASFLGRLTQFWNPDEMDALLLLNTTSASPGSDLGREMMGEFYMDQFNALTFRDEREVAPFLYTGAQIITPEVIRAEALGRFNMKQVWAPMTENGRLKGLMHDGKWFAIHTLDQLPVVESKLKYALG